MPCPWRRAHSPFDREPHLEGKWLFPSVISWVQLLFPGHNDPWKVVIHSLKLTNTDPIITIIYLLLYNRWLPPNLEYLKQQTFLAWARNLGVACLGGSGLSRSRSCCPDVSQGCVWLSEVWAGAGAGAGTLAYKMLCSHTWQPGAGYWLQFPSR